MQAVLSTYNPEMAENMRATRRLCVRCEPESASAAQFGEFLGFFSTRRKAGSLHGSSQFGSSITLVNEASGNRWPSTARAIRAGRSIRLSRVSALSSAGQGHYRHRPQARRAGLPRPLRQSHLTTTLVQLLTTSSTALVNSSRCANAPSSSASSWSIALPVRCQAQSVSWRRHLVVRPDARPKLQGRFDLYGCCTFLFFYRA